jgi:transcriptional regulator with PAS, ATPase and Fis domain
VFDIHADGLAVLRAHEWPGNVRELKAAVETAASFAHFKGRSAVVADDLSVSSSALRASVTLPDSSFYEQVENFKARLIREALELHGGNKARVADTLQLDRGTVRRILERGQ